MTATPIRLLTLSWLFLLSDSNSIVYLTRMGHLEMPVPRMDAQTPNASWISQKLDHFNNLGKTWKQRYYENLQYHSPGGPVFVFIGGEAELDPFFLRGGQMMDLAANIHAAAFGLDHRYYGKSIPDHARNNETYKYLSSPQALADLEHFIRHIKKVHQELQGAKVIVFGCSYAGNLATWMRLKYPDLVYGAVASCAPVHAQVDFPEYMETVGESLQKYDPACEAAVRNATTEMRNTMDVQDDKQATIEFTGFNGHNLMELFLECSHIFADIVQNHYERIPEVCSIMMNSSFTPLERYRNVYYLKDFLLSPLWTANKEGETHHVTLMGRFYSPNSNDTWAYQFCNEFGYLQTFSENQPFGEGYHLDDRIKFCSKYGISKEQLYSNVKRTNDNYGGHHPNVTRVVFVNGDLDPWHKLGITTDLNPESPAILIKGSSHCTNTFSYEDSESLAETHKRIQQILTKWIEDYS